MTFWLGHEVGHALFTPDENWLEKVVVPPQFVNVVEDARIEKMMKRKYAGLGKTFYHGYKELQDEDFFSISDSNIADSLFYYLVSLRLHLVASYKTNIIFLLLARPHQKFHNLRSYE